MKYDLEERITKLAENIISLCKEISRNKITFPLIDQLVRSGTSIEVNYTEANGDASKKDFRNKIILAKKEAMETKYWLRLIVILKLN
ncbi:MAG: four helix bundle protein [Patescibacteria group bacterium]|nr:four helix bundle protein [Patescibacteria group bacterium]